MNKYINTIKNILNIRIIKYAAFISTLTGVLFIIYLLHNEEMIKIFCRSEFVESGVFHLEKNYKTGLHCDINLLSTFIGILYFSIIFFPFSLLMIGALYFLVKAFTRGK